MPNMSNYSTDASHQHEWYSFPPYGQVCEKCRILKRSVESSVMEYVPHYVGLSSLERVESKLDQILDLLDAKKR